MSRLPPPPESPVKGVESAVEPGSLDRFKRLASRLFGVDKDAFGDTLAKDERERAKRRALSRSPPGQRKGDHNG